MAMASNYNPPSRRPGPALRLTRRRLLESVGAVALAAPQLASAHTPSRGEPFSDGSLFVEDGTGWVE
jgi:hypothetical protein